MDAAGLGRRLLETTRGRIVALLRRGARTVEELARALGLTDNAVRNHLSALERDGLVRVDGVRRGAGAGKPATLYEIDPAAAPLFSRAYSPVLSTLLDVLAAELPASQAESLMRETGRRVARGVGGRAAGDLDARLRAAAAVLDSLGGDVEIVHEEGSPLLRSAGCPLSVAVSHRPETCLLVETLVAEIVGEPARNCCERGERPRCCFAIGPTDGAP